MTKKTLSPEVQARLAQHFKELSDPESEASKRLQESNPLWEAEIAKLEAQYEASTRITAEDLNFWIGPPCP